MREIDASQVTEAIAKLCVEANCFLAEDVRCALCTAERQEPFAPAREILHILCRNEQIARQDAYLQRRRQHLQIAVDLLPTAVAVKLQLKTVAQPQFIAGLIILLFGLEHLHIGKVIVDKLVNGSRQILIVYPLVIVARTHRYPSEQNHKTAQDFLHKTLF